MPTNNTNNAADNDDNDGIDGVKQRAFTVHGKRNPDKKYTFQRFTSARQGSELFQTTDVTLAEKMELRDEIVMLHEDSQRKIARMERQGRKLLDLPTYAIPICYLTVDDAWARDKLVDWNHTADIAMDFHPKSLAVPSVSIRSIYDQRQELIDIIFSLTDGVHRTTAAMELGYTDITASVQLVNSRREEAQISSDSNYGRRAHAGGDILKNRMSSEEERILALKALVESHGFALSRRLGIKTWPQIGAVPTLERLLRKYGVEVITRVFELLGDPQFTHWHGSSATLTADVLSGMSLYVHEFEQPGFIHSNMTAHMLRNTTPTLIESLAESVTKPIASEVFNRVVCPAARGLISEDGRAYKTCTAFVQQVKELFKERNKPQTDYLSRFKSSFELFYSTSGTKMADLIGNRKFCASRGMPDYWWLKKNSALTR
jgi:hypothetical protein